MANQTQHCSQKEEWKGLFQEHSFFFFFFLLRHPSYFNKLLQNLGFLRRGCPAQCMFCPKLQGGRDPKISH